MEINPDEKFDFGFSAVGEEEMLQPAVESKDKLTKMYQMIEPLLDNLMANPEKDYIHWPDSDRIN